MKRKVNITIECENDEKAYYLELLLRDNYNVTDFTLLTDTKELYETNSHFRSIIKEYKKIKKQRDNLINEHKIK